jgi:hypothetical protein
MRPHAPLNPCDCCRCQHIDCIHVVFNGAAPPRARHSLLSPMWAWQFAHCKNDRYVPRRRFGSQCRSAWACDDCRWPSAYQIKGKR